MSEATGTERMTGLSALLLYGQLPPAEIELRPWYADRRLKRLAEGG